MKYELKSETLQAPESPWTALRRLRPLLSGEWRILTLASAATICNSLVNLAAPLIIAHIVDSHLATGQSAGLWLYILLLFLLYCASLFTSYGQTSLMGGVGQRVLFKLRSRIFDKLQDLPLAFFQANRTGDLISRINNDTDKLNLFFSQTLVQFVGSIVIMIGAAIFLLVIKVKLGAAALLPAVALLVLTRAISPWVKHRNTVAAESTGSLSGEVSESLNNFKVIVAFDRRDFLLNRFQESNLANYHSAVGAGIANNLYVPVFGLAANLAQLIVLVFGVYLISRGEFTVGLLIGFLAYVVNFYHPLRQLAALWANFQVAVASWDRVSAILRMESDMPTVAPAPTADSSVNNRTALIEFRDVSFRYSVNQWVLQNVSFSLERGKAYAFVGPTGGGKTTTASLMSRLYDPSEGTVLLDGTDIRSIDAEERAHRIGFILQDPVLFSGTIRENLLYGNHALFGMSSDELTGKLEAVGLSDLLSRVDGGLDAYIDSTADSLSLGQKQLIAFMRAVLRGPDLLILDEATANIDSITEQQLESILRRLPEHTTLVIIAHRLNTIENADEIFFVDGGNICRAGSIEHAVEMLIGNSNRQT